MTSSTLLSVIKATPVNLDMVKYPITISPIIKGIRSVIDPEAETIQVWKGTFNLKPEYVLPGPYKWDGILSSNPNQFWIYDIQEPVKSFDKRRLTIASIKETDYIKHVPLSEVDSFKMIVALFDWYIEYGHAGIILRDLVHTYTTGPTLSWMQITELPKKIGQVITITWSGEMFSSVTVDVQGKHVHVFKGFTAEDREYFTRYPEAIERRFVELIDDGSLRYYQIAPVQGAAQ